MTEDVILNVSGNWEKITFTGDSGAVDHVITKDAAKAFNVIETNASRNGLTYRAANGTPIKNYGEKKVNRPYEGQRRIQDDLPSYRR